MGSALQSFHAQNYISIESYRRDGRAVRTPVWFAEHGEELYVYTEADSGKAESDHRFGPVSGVNRVIDVWMCGLPRSADRKDRTTAMLA